MAKIVYASLQPADGKAVPGSDIPLKAVIGPDGEKMIVHVVDANSSTFGQDLRAVFGRNVTEARRANQRALEEQSRAASGA